MTTKRSKGTKHRLRHVGALIPPDGFESLVSVGVGPQGPVAAWAEGRADPIQTLPDNERDLFMPDQIRAIALASYTTSELHPVNVVVAEAPITPGFIQPLPDGGYLLVRSRCAWTPQGPDKNAIVVDPYGRIARRGTIGDGISHLQVDSDGRIWAGYFDEGIIGNLGWGFTGPKPLGASGLVRWTLNLDKEWELPEKAGADVLDCYAMNVSDDAVVAYAYTDFPLILVRDDCVSIHPTGTSGAKGVAISGNEVNIVGSYTDRSLVVTGTLGPESFNRPQRGHLTMPSGKPIPHGLMLECRGSTVNFFDSTDWYQFEQGYGSAN